MKVYYWFYLGFAICAGLVYRDKRWTIDQKNKRVGIVGFFLVFLLLACRHPYMGIDLGWGTTGKGYLQSFWRLSKIPWRIILQMEEYLNYERGYIIFNKFVGYINRDTQFFLMMCALVSIAPIAIYMSTRSKHSLMTIYVFIALPVFHLFFSGLRQSVAIGITVASMYFVEKKNPIFFAIMIWLASLFHSTAWTFIIAYPLYHLRIGDIGRLLALGVIPVIYLFKESLFGTLSKLFAENAKIEETGALTMFLVFVLIYLFLIVFNDPRDKRQNGYTNLFLVACIVQAFAGINNIAMRIGYYFMIYAALAVPNTMENFRHINIRYNTYYTLVKSVIMIVFVIYGLTALYNGGFSWSRTFPYLYYWQFG